MKLFKVVLGKGLFTSRKEHFGKPKEQVELESPQSEVVFKT